MTTAQEIGERVAQARREKGVRERRDITQREVAKAVGVSPTTVSDCEKGKQMPGELVIQKLAAYLDVTPAYLRYGVTESTPTTLRATGDIRDAVPTGHIGTGAKPQAATKETKRKA